MQEIIINDKDLFVMNLVHYFITEKDYNPVIIHGIADEIWLENMESDYKIIRIVSHHIHNNEQLGFDKFKLNQIVKKLKLKTLTFKMNVLNIYTDLGDNVNLQDKDVFVAGEDDIKNNTLIEIFPDIVEKTKHDDNGINYFLKITDNLNSTTAKKNRINDKIFSKKYPLITYILMGINILIFIYMLIGNYEEIIMKYGMYTPYVKMGEYYRLFTCMFVHSDTMHILLNMYALYTIGPVVERYYGKGKYLFIYIISGLLGSVFSGVFMSANSISIGASGAIFGLLGSICYFTYYYRATLQGILRGSIIPVIVINLIIGFLSPSIDLSAHIGGLIGGILVSMGLGIGDKYRKSDQINGFIVLIVMFAFLMYMMMTK